MYSSSHSRYKHNSKILDDLDTQPVREVRGRVLNDVPHNRPNQQHMNLPDFQYVDVNFPGPSSGNSKDKKFGEQKSEDNTPVAREAAGGAAAATVTADLNQLEAATKRANAGKREFTERMLRKGTPVWEAVPRDEWNITLNAEDNHRYNRQEMPDQSINSIRIIPRAVWEDVQSDDNNKIQLKSRKQNSQSISSTTIKSGAVINETNKYTNDNLTPLPVRGDQLASERIMTRSYCPNDYSTKENKSIREDDNSQKCEYSKKHAQLDNGTTFQEKSDVTTIGFIPVDPTPPVTKKKFGGRLDKGKLISTSSWREGDSLARQQFGPMKTKVKLKEKDEDEYMAKENLLQESDISKKRQDKFLSTTSSKRIKKIPQVQEPEVVEEPAPKVRSYNQEAVRKYLADQRAQRSKERRQGKEEEIKQKALKEERLKELAVRTKELVPVTKKNPERQTHPKKKTVQSESHPDWGPVENSISKSSKQYGSNIIPNTAYNILPPTSSSAKDSTNFNVQSEFITKPKKEDIDILNKEKENSYEINNKKENEASRVVERFETSNQDEEKENQTEIPEKKRRKDKIKKQKHKMKYASDSDSVSDIVSKALKECEKAVMGADVSGDNFTSLSSVSDISSDVELLSTTTESLDKSKTKQQGNTYNRVESVSKMAQSLIQRIEKEEENLQKRITDNANVIEKRQNSEIRESLSKEPVAYSEIEAMSVDELIARMTSMLPETGVKKSKGNSPGVENTSQQHLGKDSGSDEQNSERSNRRGSRNILFGSVPPHASSSTIQSSSLIKSNSSHTPPGSRSKLRDLVMPDTPVLHVSRNNAMQNGMMDIGTPYVIKPEATPVLTPFSVLPIEFSLPGNNVPPSFVTENLPGLVDITAYKDKTLKEKAARRIQAAYRGYCVRKVTSHLINKPYIASSIYKQSDIIKQSEVPKYSEKSRQSSKPKKYFREKHFELMEDSSEMEEDTSLSEGPIEEVDWHKIRIELEKKEQFVLKETEYVVQREDIPEWVKPYIVLSETGNVKKFLESKTRAELIADNQSLQNRNTNSKELKDTMLSISNLSEIISDSHINDNNSDSEKEKFDVSSAILNNTTLSEGSLNDSSLSEGPLEELLEFNEPSLYEKETQTFFSAKKHSPGKRNMEEKNRIDISRNGGKNLNSEKKSSVIHEEHNAKSSQRQETYSKSQAYKTKKCEVRNKDEFVNISRSSLHDETLEEGLIEGFGSTIGDTITSNAKPLLTNSGDLHQSKNSGNQLQLSSGPIAESSRSVDHVQICSSPSVDSSFEESNFPRGPHMGGASLRLRLNAELMYQDNVSEALRQLEDVEQKEGHVIGAQIALQQKQQQDLENQHKAEQIRKEQERRNRVKKREVERLKRAEEERKHEAERAQLKEDERRVEEKRRLLKEEEKRQNHHSNLAILSIERMEEEAKQRLAKLEQEIKERAERILAVAAQQHSLDRAIAPIQTQNPTQDVIAAAAAAAVGATISHWEKLYPSNRNTGLQIQTTQTVSEFPSYTSQEYSTTIVGSNGSYSTQSHLSRSERRSSLIRRDDAYSGNISDSQSSVQSMISERRSHVSVSKSKSPVEEIINTRDNSSSVAEVLPSEMPFLSLSPRNESVEESISIKENSQISLGTQDISEDVDIVSDKSKTSIFANSFVSENIGSESYVRTESFSSPVKSHSTVISEQFLKEKSSNSKTKSSSAELISSSIVSKSQQSSIPENSSVANKSNAEVVSTSIPSATNSVPESISNYEKRNSGSIRDESKGSRFSETTASSKDSESESSVSHSKSKLQSSQESLYSKSSESNKHQGRRKVIESDVYSESFENESGSENSVVSQRLRPVTSTAAKSIGSSGDGDLSVMLSANNMVLDSLVHSFPGSNYLGGSSHLGASGVGSSRALGLTLSLVESLQKEEEVRAHHQRAMLKLQEQSLVEEARWKLEALAGEGGSGLRKRQRGVLLQLREQRQHLRRLMESQNLAAQQRKLLLLQHHSLLAATSMSGSTRTSRFLSQSQPHSPSPVSPRITTPRMADFNLTSSSDTQEDISLLLKGKDLESSSQSEEGTWRHNSEDRKRGSVNRHEKRRNVDIEALQQSQEDRDKTKEIGKPKRKTEFITKRRDKREKSVSPVESVEQKREIISRKETLNISLNDSQSSVAEDVASDTFTQSDAASSISENDSNVQRTISVKKPSSTQNIYSSSTSQSEIKSVKSKNTETNISSTPEEVLSGVVESKISSKISEALSYSNIESESVGESIKNKSADLVPENNSSNSYTQPLSEISSKTSDQIATDSRIGRGSSFRTSSEVRTGSEVRSGESRTSRSSNESKTGSESSKVNDFRILRSVSESRGSLDGKSINDYRNPRKGIPLPLRVPLSPRSPQRHYRRYSSESDDSMSFSQNETASDISDGEGKLLALKEQLASRRAEADRLKKEKRRLRRERLASQEQALLQQISAYDAYIVQARQDLEEESRQLQQASLVKPLIKKPQVAETRRKSDIGIISPEKSDISDLSQLSEVSKVDLTASPRSSNEKSETGSISEDSKDSSRSVKSKTYESSTASSSSIKSQGTKSVDKHSIDLKDIKRSIEENSENAKLKHNLENEAQQDVSIPQTKTDAVHDSLESSVSENISFEEDFESGQSSINLVEEKTHSHEDSGPETERSPSHISASSTETIVHSPKKQSVTYYEDAEATSGEVTPSALSAAENDEQEEWGEKGIDSEFEITAPKVERVGEPVTEIQLSGRSVDKNLPGADETFLVEPVVKKIEDLTFFVEPEETKAEDKTFVVEPEEKISEDRTFVVEQEERKIEIFLPNLDLKSSDEDNKETSIDESIAEESFQSESHYSISERELEKTSIVKSKKYQPLELSGAGENEGIDKYETSYMDLETKKDSEDQQKTSLHKVDTDDEEKDILKDSIHDSNEIDKRSDETSVISETSIASTSKNSQASDINKVDDRINEQLVDSVTSSILSNLMKDTSKLFSNILKEKSQMHEIATTKTKDSEYQPLELSGAGENEGIERYGTSYMDFEIKEDNKQNAREGLEEDVDSKDQTIKSQILRRVSQLISEGNSSPRSVASSPRSTDLPLTPHLTFDLSPDVLSPKSASTSPRKSKSPASPPSVLSEVVESSVTSTSFESGVIGNTDNSSQHQEGEEKSPEKSPKRALDYILDTASLTSKLLRITSSEVDDEGRGFAETESTAAEFSVEGIEGDWFDDDFWTNSDSKKKQQQLKAEEQRIAAEIARLEELQRLQEQYPGLVIRDIPNKPPPPYTPPGATTPTGTSPAPDYSTTPDPPEQSSHLQKSSNVISVGYRLSRSDLRGLAHEMVVVVGRDRTQVLEVVNAALGDMLNAWEEGTNPQLLHHTPDHHNILSPSHSNSDEEDENSIRVFHKLLYQLVQEMLGQVWQVRSTPKPPVWQRSVLPPVKLLQLLQQPPRLTLPSYITAQVEVLFGWAQHKPKETLMIRWAKKHRDLVDQVLVGELAVEESSWTHYGVDEAAVKTSLAGEIFTALIDDTVRVCIAVLQKKLLVMQEQ